MAKRKIWSVGEEILATDITNNFKFGGDGSDGTLTVTSGITTIDLGSLQSVIKIGRAHV